MKKYYPFISAMLVFCLLTGFHWTTYLDEEVAYPEDYRSWTHVKSGMLGPEHPNVNYRGFNHFYANDLAVKGYAEGDFPQGSILVVDVIAAVPGANVTSEASRHHMDVMVRDSLRFASTGGWGYAQFEGDNRPRVLTLEQKNTCNNCHLKQKDHVFSELRK